MAESTASIGHVVDEDSNFITHVTNKHHWRHFIRLLPLLVNQREINVQLVRNRCHSSNTCDWYNYNSMLCVVQTDDTLGTEFYTPLNTIYVISAAVSVITVKQQSEVLGIHVSQTNYCLKTLRSLLSSLSCSRRSGCPVTRTVRYSPHSFAVAEQSTWNSLTVLLHSCHLPSSFFCELKTELFNKACH